MQKVGCPNCECHCSGKCLREAPEQMIINGVEYVRADKKSSFKEPTPCKKSISKVIKQLKFDKGWSNADLLAAFKLNFSASQLCQIASGGRFPTPGFLKSLSDFSGCSVEELIDMIVEKKMTRYKEKLFFKYKPVLKKH